MNKPTLNLASVSCIAAALACGAARADDLVPDGQWRGSGTAALSVASGNTRSETLNLNMNAAAVTDSDKLTYYGQALYGRAKANGLTSTSANLERAGGRYDRNLTWEVYAYGGLDFTHDQITLIDLRSVVAGGLGYHLVRATDNRWDVFSGLTYKVDRYLEPGVVINDELRTHYEAPEVEVGEESVHKLNATTNLHQRLDFFEDLHSPGAYRAQFDAGVDVAMTKRMQLTVALQDRYSSLAVSPILKNDVLLTAGLTYKFGPQ
ncbi:MAG TPA: DUF481 domain-containing protein [Burkholderiaceae bacterium]|nr:DUF481 domain-containing protein [Burkholderiaceae bacterium]